MNKLKQGLLLEENSDGRAVVKVEDLQLFLDRLWKLAQKEALKMGKITKRS
jgi:hypothetical protein